MGLYEHSLRAWKKLYFTEYFLLENNSLQIYFESADNTTYCSAGNRKVSVCWIQHTDQFQKSPFIPYLQVCLHLSGYHGANVHQANKSVQHSSSHTYWLWFKSTIGVFCNLTFKLKVSPTWAELLLHLDSLLRCQGNSSKLAIRAPEPKLGSLF